MVYDATGDDGSGLEAALPTDLCALQRVGEGELDLCAACLDGASNQWARLWSLCAVPADRVAVGCPVW